MGRPRPGDFTRRRDASALATAGPSPVLISPARPTFPLPEAPLPAPREGWTLRSSWRAAWSYADEHAGDVKPSTAAHYAWHALIDRLDELDPSHRPGAELAEEHYLSETDYSLEENRP